MDTTPGQGADRPTGALAPSDLRILEDQLARMRGMLFGYSERFFERIRTYLLIVLGLLVIAGSGIFPSAVVAVPFLVPFAFLETGYLFYYTVFARRHAEYLERAINARLGRDVPRGPPPGGRLLLPARCPQDRRDLDGQPAGHDVGDDPGLRGRAALLWLVGVLGTINLLALNEVNPAPLGHPRSCPCQLVWTLAIAGHLMYSSLTRRDEKPLLAALDAAYGAPPSTSPD